MEGDTGGDQRAWNCVDSRVLRSDLDVLALDFLDIQREIGIFSCLSLAALSFVLYPGVSDTN